MWICLPPLYVIIEPMAYRNVFSQMFDVRPRKETGDLDLEKIEKIVGILNLKAEGWLAEVVPKEKIIDLKNQPLGIYVENEPIKKRRKRKARLASGENKDSLSYLTPSLSEERGRDFWPEFYQEIAPSQEEIISILEMIEATDQALKKQDGGEIKDKESAGAAVEESLGDETFFEIPIKAVELTVEAPAVEQAVSAEEAPESAESSEQVFLGEDESRDLKSQFSDWVLHQVYDLPQTPSADDSLLALASKDEPLAPQRLASEDAAFPLPNEMIAPELLLLDNKPRITLNWRRLKKSLLVLAAATVLVLALVPLFGWFSRTSAAKNEALNSSLAAYGSLIKAKESLSQLNFSQAEKDFKAAHDYFSAADSQIRGAAGWLVFILERIPGVSYFSSRTKLIQAGEDLSQAGQSFAGIASLFSNASLTFSKDSQSAPMSENLTRAKSYLEDGLRLLVSAKQNLQDIKISSLPKDIQPQMVLLEDKMPQIIATAALALDWSDRFLEILGHKRAKKYLLIFQNNAETRPTGGFIGTYGILDLDQGQIKNLFIDGIYNPDGQLKEKIVPPAPIQKVSTAWSTHDANWFADFPLSAQKIMWFYEKTGGETPDGVISLTPTVIERLLEITGPIEMPEYGVVLDSKNFVDAAQNEIEVNYDKTLNQPKKILADFAPRFIDKVAQEIKNNNLEILKTINQSLEEKHILVYFGDEKLEQFTRQQGWAGEILPAPADYLAVVNTNINGYKTDRVIKEDVKYVSEIQADGSILNTVSITRRHQGGEYDWYKKVNADYLRVFVPRGSELLSVNGQTRENVSPPIDYNAAGFKADSDVLAQEQSIKIDEASGTQVFEESDKTVFGNWVYVSPGESVTLMYKYRLPFKLDTSRPIDFSLTAQKQSGSIGSGFSAQILPPQNCRIFGEKNIQTDLSVDRQITFSLGCR